MTILLPQSAGRSSLAVDLASPLVLIEHQSDILGEAHGFGGFLFDRTGRIVLDPEGATWLYTTQIVGGRWESWVRRFNVNTLEAGPARLVLLPETGRDRAVLHHIVAIADDLIVGFHCTGRGIGACVAPAPDADFIVDPDFILEPVSGWETRNGPTDGWSLESNGAYVLIEDTDRHTIFWQGYDSYRREGRLGDLGWVKVRVDKVTRRVQLIGRHPGNPLAFRQPAWRCVRCGGNLSSEVRIHGKHAFFYYLRPNESEVFLGLTLSSDPLFFDAPQHHVVDTALGDEAVIEKFEVVEAEGHIVMFYESQFIDGSWHTGLRRYRHAEA